MKEMASSHTMKRFFGAFSFVRIWLFPKLLQEIVCWRLKVEKPAGEDKEGTFRRCADTILVISVDDLKKFRRTIFRRKLIDIGAKITSRMIIMKVYITLFNRLNLYLLGARCNSPLVFVFG